MYNLDLKDRKLLHELDVNSRQSVNRLAKKVGLSKDAIKYRMNKLLADGVIKSFNVVVDSGKLGLISFRLFLKFCQLSPAKESEILDYLKKNKNLLWLVQVEGNWDVNTWFLYKSIDEMNDFIKEFLKKYKNYVEEKEFGIYTSVDYFNRMVLPKQPRGSPNRIISLPNNVFLDNHDIKILELLSKNARMSIIDISQNVRLTPKTIINRIKRLENDKIIVGYRAEFDLEKLGLKYYKLHVTTFNTTNDKLNLLNEYLKTNSFVVYINEVLGGYDIEFEVQIENESKLREFLDDLRSKFSSIIKDYEVLHYFKEHRLRFFPTL